MSRLEILLLIGIACTILATLSQGMYIEGLSDKEISVGDSKEVHTNKGSNDKASSGTPAPDEYIDRDSREYTTGDSLMNSHSLKTMTPLSLTQREVDSDHAFRWVADEWPKCKERCAHRPIHRQVKCFRRNGKRYSDDIPIDTLFTVPAFEKDALGHTVCDNAQSGININVKPNQSTFCSLLNHCTPSKHKVLKLPKPIPLEQMQQYDRQSIGFSLIDIQSLSNEQQRVLQAAFPETRHIRTVTGPKGSIPQTETYKYSTVRDIKLHITSLTDAEKEILTSSLKSIRLRSQMDKTFDIGSLIFSTIGLSI